MRKIILSIIIFVSFPLFSQKSIESIIKNLAPSSNSTSIDISKNKTGKFIIGKSDFKSLKKYKVNFLFKANSSNSKFSLVTLNSCDRFILFTIVANELLIKEQNVVYPTSYATLFVYDKITSTLISCRLETPGTIIKTKKSKITFMYELDKIIPKIIKLNNNFLPISSLSDAEYQENKKVNSSENYIISVYNFDNKKSKIQNVFIPFKESSILKIEYVLFKRILDEIPLLYDEEIECENKNCKIEFLDFIEF